VETGERGHSRAEQDGHSGEIELPPVETDATSDYVVVKQQVTYVPPALDKV